MKLSARLALPLLLLSVSCAAVRSWDARSLSVEALGQGERAEVVYETKGCWSHCRFWIVIHGGSNPTAEVRSEVVSVRSDLGGQAHLCGGEGQLELSSELVSRLDATIQRYRQLPTSEEDCSARNDITLNWTTTVGEANESYVDDPCFYPDNAFEEVLEQVGGMPDPKAARQNQPVHPTASGSR